MSHFVRNSIDQDKSEDTEPPTDQKEVAVPEEEVACEGAQVLDSTPEYPMSFQEVKALKFNRF